MGNEDTVTMEWFYSTPCGRCGKDVRIEKDRSAGKTRYARDVTAKCPSCGHEETYKASAVDSKPVVS